MADRDIRSLTAAEKKKLQVQYNATKGRLPGAEPTGWAKRHPTLSGYLDWAQGFLPSMPTFGGPPTKTYGFTPEGMPLPGNPATSFGGTGINETVVPKGFKGKSGELRDRVRNSLADYVPQVNSQFAISDDEAETVLAGFMDSQDGRGLGSISDEKEFLNKARTGYTRFAQKWAGVGDGERRIKIDDPVVLDADTATAKEVADSFAANKPVIFKNASKYGFNSSKIGVQGDGKTVKDPEKVRQAKDPLMTKQDFIDVLRYIRGGM